MSIHTPDRGSSLNRHLAFGQLPSVCPYMMVRTPPASVPAMAHSAKQREHCGTGGLTSTQSVPSSAERYIWPLPIFDTATRLVADGSTWIERVVAPSTPLGFFSGSPARASVDHVAPPSFETASWRS